MLMKQNLDVNTAAVVVVMALVVVVAIRLAGVIVLEAATEDALVAVLVIVDMDADVRQDNFRLLNLAIEK